MRVFVTGGCGFIGSAVVRHLIDNTNYEVVNVDKMTYAATSESVESVAATSATRNSRSTSATALRSKPPSSTISRTQSCISQRSHVDRSIDGRTVPADQHRRHDASSPGGAN